MEMKIEKRKKPLKLNVKTVVFYLVLLALLIFISKQFTGSPDEMRLKKALVNDPTNPAMALRLADYYYTTEKYNEAVKFYKRAFALMKEEEIRCEYLRKMVVSLLEYKQFDAVVYIEKGLKKGCDREYFLGLYSKSLEILVKRLDEQIIALDKAGSSSASKISEIRTVYVKKGVVITLNNGMDPAFFMDRLKIYEKELYSNLKNYDMSNAQQRFALGRAAKDAEVWEAAQNLLGGAWESLKGAQRGRCLYYYAYTFFREKQYSTALSLYKKAKNDWNSTLVNYWLSKTYYNLGMRDEAINAINYTLRMDPSYPAAKRFKEKLMRGE